MRLHRGAQCARTRRHRRPSCPNPLHKLSVAQLITLLPPIDDFIQAGDITERLLQRLSAPSGVAKGP